MQCSRRNLVPLSGYQDTCVLTQQGGGFLRGSCKAGLGKAQLPSKSPVTVRFPSVVLQEAAGCLPSEAATKLQEQLWPGLADERGRLLFLFTKQLELWTRYAILKEETDRRKQCSREECRKGNKKHGIAIFFLLGK